MKNSAVGFVCTTSSWGGLEMNVLRLALWLGERGWRIILYVQGGSPLYRRAEESQIEVRHLRPSFKHGDFLNAYRLAQCLRNDDVKALVLHERKDILLGALTRFGSDSSLKLVYMQHMHIGVDKKDIYHTWLYSSLDAWVVPLNMLKERLLKKTRFESDKVSVIPFGIDLKNFTCDKPGKQVARQRLNLPLDATIVGVIGRIDPEKCQETLIKAGAELRKKGVTVDVLIVGNETLNEQTNYAAYLRQLSKELAVDESVHFRPSMDEIWFAYAALDIFALTSKSETYGMVTIEAMASGLPVIGTRHGGTREIIRHNENGILIERETPAELADAIMRILSDSEFAQRIGTQAQRDARLHYSHTTQCDLLEALFQRLLKIQT